MKYGGPGRDRTDDLFHAMEARSQLRHRPTIETETPTPDESGSREVLNHSRPHREYSQREVVSDGSGSRNQLSSTVTLQECTMSRLKGGTGVSGSY